MWKGVFVSEVVTCLVQVYVPEDKEKSLWRFQEMANTPSATPCSDVFTRHLLASSFQSVSVPA